MSLPLSVCVHICACMYVCLYVYLPASRGYYCIVFASNFFKVKILFQVKIVIVDSVTFHFRQDFDDMALRTRLLSGMALKLMKLAKVFSLAVRINLVCS